jgi:DNA-binding NarL/FixJ family response regulator
MKLRILLVDDEDIFRMLARGLLADEPGLEIVAEAGNGREALLRVAEVMPDLVCMDIDMPHMNGIEATRRLSAQWPGVRVIGLSSHTDSQYIRGMFDAGACAYVAKDEAYRELLPAVRAIRRERAQGQVI